MLCFWWQERYDDGSPVLFQLWPSLQGDRKHRTAAGGNLLANPCLPLGGWQGVRPPRPDDGQVIPRWRRIHAAGKEKVFILPHFVMRGFSVRKSDFNVSGAVKVQ